MTREMLEEALQLTKGALIMAYPGYDGLPDWEPAMCFFENREDPAMFLGQTLFDKEKTTLWFANKELRVGKKLKEFVKAPEKSKIICKMTAKGSGAPVREPIVNEEVQKNMVA